MNRPSLWLVIVDQALFESRIRWAAREMVVLGYPRETIMKMSLLNWRGMCYLN